MKSFNISEKNKNFAYKKIRDKYSPKPMINGLK
jgi:hypothetical protein